MKTLLMLCAVFLLLSCTSVDDLSKQKPFSEYVDKELRIERLCRLLKCAVGQYRFSSYVLHEQRGFDCKVIEEVKPGKLIRIDSFKGYYNGESGSTSIIAVGEIYSETMDRKINFEYHWGFNQTPLPAAVWEIDSLVSDRKLIVP